MDINRVKRQVLSSIKIDESDLSTLASNKFNQHFFKDHVFSNNIKGSEESIKNITRTDLVNFHKRSFVKNNLVIGVAGNINVNKIKKYIELVFGELKDNQKNYSIKIKEDFLIVPHPRMSVRNFVLLPLFEICNHWKHPKTKQKITELMSKLPLSSITAIKVMWFNGISNYA